MWLFGLIIVLSLLGYKAYMNTKEVELNKVEINEASHTTDKTLNILHISDMHLENISITPIQLYEKVKDEEIDFIALSGDFLDRKRSIPKLIPYLNVFNKINPKHGIYAVFGNHDYVLKSHDFEMLKQILENHNCKTLRNENVSISVKGTPVNIIGIDDFSTNRSHLSSAYQDIKPSGYNLVLTHDPNVVLEMNNNHFDYLLAGHFHGGQILYPKAFHLVKMGKLARMNIVKGLHYTDGKPYYISEGLGQTGLNIRVGCRPEITIHQLSINAISQEKAV